jgi:hypothetical protein
MARNLSTAIYSGSLQLDKVTGLRADRKRAIPAKNLLKADTSLPQPKRSIKTAANVTSDGLKKS